MRWNVNARRAAITKAPRASTQYSNRTLMESPHWLLGSSVRTYSYEQQHRQRQSPTALWECEGDCRNKHTQTTEAAHVICLSACGDEQIVWGRPGARLTIPRIVIFQELIHILRETPKSSLKNLLAQLTDRMHERCLPIHKHAWKKSRGPHDEPFAGEMDNFQDPQLASHVPLNMDEPFTL